jgi:glyceraldehyde-3-phosphate dehydrogenase (NAD(P))
LTIRVAINGYGTIGKRVADAVLKQKDMTLAGVTKTKPNYEARLIAARGVKVYATSPEKLASFEGSAVKASGTLEDLLKESDIVVDCTPGKVGASYKPLYQSLGIKAIFQGGEKHDMAGFSFNAYCNYREALGLDMLRVVSCNTTGLCRSINALDKAFGVKKVRAVLVRRGADPAEVSKGPINSIVPDPATIPSHHGPDVQRVLPKIDITTSALAVPTTLMHVHVLNVEINREATEQDVMGAFGRYPRIKIFSAAEGIASTAEIIEFTRDIGRPRYDLWELAVWKESIKSFGRELYLTQAVHQESIVVPENIDAIRAMARITEDPDESIKATDESLGIGR